MVETDFFVCLFLFVEPAWKLRQRCGFPKAETKDRIESCLLLWGWKLVYTVQWQINTNSVY